MCDATSGPDRSKRKKRIVLGVIVASPLLLTGVLCLGVVCFSGKTVDPYTSSSGGAENGGQTERADRNPPPGGGGGKANFGGSVGNLIGGLVKKRPTSGPAKIDDTPPDDKPAKTNITQKPTTETKTTAKTAGQGNDTSLVGKLLSFGKSQPPDDETPPPTRKKSPPDDTKTPPVKKPPPDKTPKNPWGEMKTAKLIDEKSRRTVTTFRIPEAWKAKSQVAPVSERTAVHTFEAASDNDEERFAYLRFDLTAEEFQVLCRGMKLNVSLENGYYLGPEKLLSDFLTPMYSQTASDVKITYKKAEDIKVQDPAARAYGLEIGLEYRRDKDALRYVERTIVIVGCSRANGGRVDMMIYSLALRNTPDNKTRLVNGLQTIASSRQDMP